MRAAALGDVLDGPEAPERPALLVELQLGLLAHPFHLPFRHDPVLDVVRFALQGRRPTPVDVLPVLLVDRVEKGGIGQRRSLRNPENPMGFVRPTQFVAPHVQAPAPGPSDGLSPVQIMSALLQRDH